MTTVQNTANISKPAYLINVQISDFILTPVACAALVNEVMKNLLYQRSQIPYPYTWLKSIIKKKRRSLEESGESTLKNLMLYKHYQVVSKAYDSAENIMSDIIRIFPYYGGSLKEVILVIGVTPFCPKEVFTIKISSLAHGHVERNHVTENCRKQPKLLRSLFLENNWMELMEKSLSCSNTHIFLKLNGVNNEMIHDESVFTPCKPLLFSSNVKHTIINLNYSESEEFLCCDKLEVFEDSGMNSPGKIDSVNVKQIVCGDDDDHTELWLQSKILIQGFKDYFINKVSACELW